MQKVFSYEDTESGDQSNKDFILHPPTVFTQKPKNLISVHQSSKPTVRKHNCQKIFIY